MPLAIISGTKGKATFAKLTRQPTGTHFLDSGGTYGRHWQRKLPQDCAWFEVSTYGRDDEKREVMAYIPLHSFLAANLQIDTKLTRKLRRLEEKLDISFNIFEAHDAMSDALGIKKQTLDYTYNWENDLTQDFQFAVLSDSDDWYYDSDAIVLIQTHNGCDARGGFSDIVVCRPYGNYDGLSSLLDVTCGVSISSGVDAAGVELSHEDCQGLDERWQVGYSSTPVAEFLRDVAEVLTEDGKHESIKVRLKTGEIVTVYPNPRI